MAKVKTDEKKWVKLPAPREAKSSRSFETKQMKGTVSIAASTKNAEPVFANHPYFQARENERFAGVGCHPYETSKTNKTKNFIKLKEEAKNKKIEAKRKRSKGMAGIAMAVSSTDNIKTPPYCKWPRKKLTTLVNLNDDDRVDVFHKCRK